MNFREKVYVLVRQIPYGKVGTYGQIAALLSTPRAARMVGTALRSLPEVTDVPWYRIINSKGYISIENLDYPAEDQANRLVGEGIIVTMKDGLYYVDLKQYLWNPLIFVDKSSSL